MKQNNRSAYLKSDDRLVNVIAAIQALGSYRYYKRNFEEWAVRISGKNGDSSKWLEIFRDHPEFFRIAQGDKDVSLVWRRNWPKNYNVDTRDLISQKEYLALSEEDKKRISRRPLSNDDIKTLVDTAINLHSRALKRKQDKRWWIPLSIGIAGFVFGVAQFLMK